MGYEPPLFRPPSEANSYILQATIGCSWNHCTYCEMYRSKKFRVRAVADILEDIRMVAAETGDQIHKVFVADGDALIMTEALWKSILTACGKAFPNLRRVSCYATGTNLLEKTPEELNQLRQNGLSLLYIGPESGDDVTLKRIAKDCTHEKFVQAADKAHDAGMKLSTIFLLGAGGTDRSAEHAKASGLLATRMNPRFVSALTLTVTPGTPLAKLQEKGRFILPDVKVLLQELRTFIEYANPDDAVFRTNHASNYLPLSGRLPRDRERLLQTLDSALSGEIPLRPEWARGL